jgi:hypothetical protein
MQALSGLSCGVKFNMTLVILAIAERYGAKLEHDAGPVRAQKLTSWPRQEQLETVDFRWSRPAIGSIAQQMRAREYQQQI